MSVAKTLPILIASLVLASCNVACADTISQTTTVSTDNTGELFSETNGFSTEFQLFDDQFFSLTALPFDSSLGTLDNFKVSFTDVSISGNGITSDVFGSLSSTLSGQFLFEAPNIVPPNGGFNGAGGNDFQSTPGAGDPVEFELALPDFSQTFFVADAGLPFGDPSAIGTPFNPAILGAVTGTNPFQIRFSSDGPVFVNSVVDVFAEASGTISIEYHFIPVSVPEPSSGIVALLGLGALVARRRRAS